MTREEMQLAMERALMAKEEKIRKMEKQIEKLEQEKQDCVNEIVNQRAEIIVLRNKLAGVSEVLDVLIDSGLKTKEALQNCREVLEMMQAEVNR